MGPRLLCTAFDDVCGRCDITPVRLTHGEPGYDEAPSAPAATGCPSPPPRRCT